MMLFPLETTIKVPLNAALSPRLPQKSSSQAKSRKLKAFSCNSENVQQSQKRAGSWMKGFPHKICSVSSHVSANTTEHSSRAPSNQESYFSHPSVFSRHQSEEQSVSQSKVLIILFPVSVSESRCPRGFSFLP